MDNDLFKKIIQNALRDLFSQRTEEDKANREESWAWFNDEEPAMIDTALTFNDCCDLADYDARQWRYVAELIYTGKLTKKEYLELMSEEEVIREAKPPKLVNFMDLARTANIYSGIKQDEKLFQATLS